MPRKTRRLTDHDYSTKLYIAQIEATYDVDIELDVTARQGQPLHGDMTLAVYAVRVDADEDNNRELLARGAVSTATNAVYNHNVRYLLTVGMLRLIELTTPKN